MGDRGGVYGAIAGAGLGVGGYLMHSLRQTGISTVNDLVGEAMLHPNVARELLGCVAPDGTLGPLAQRPLAAAMQGVLAANAARQTAGMQQQ
jgi:hypothetical protein